MESVIFFHVYYTMWDVNLVPAQMNYTDLKIMKSMGQIDSIFEEEYLQNLLPQWQLTCAFIIQSLASA